MGTVLSTADRRLLAPILETVAGMRARHGDAPVHGLVPGLLLPSPRPESAGPIGPWLPATAMADGTAIDDLLAAAAIRWPAEPHVSAGLAWKAYAYWAVLPAVLGYASAQRVPSLAASNTYVRIHGAAPFIEFGMAGLDVTMLGTDPLASTIRPVPASLADASVHLVPDTAGLLGALRATLLDGHLAPMIEQLHRRVRIGHRTLLGSVASGICYALVRSSDVLPGSCVPIAHEILEALGVEDLVDFGPDARGVLTVRRRTCCFGFALEQPKVCAGCPVPAALLHP